MYNPLAKDQIGANVFAAGTGYRAYENGATAGEAFGLAMAWRYWYKNLTGAIFLFCLTVLATANGIACGVNDGPNQSWTPMWQMGWLAPVQAIVTFFVFGVTYVSLVDASPGFKRRAMYRWFYGLAYGWFPNVKRVYWYLLLLFPSWLMLWVTGYPRSLAHFMWDWSQTRR